MILYFSATGNSKHVATRIADEIGDKAVSIETLMDYPFDGPTSILLQIKDPYFGLVVPTYAFGLPKIVEDFLNSLKVEFITDVYSFLIATYGTTPGAIASAAKKLLKSKNNKPFDSYFSIRMPDTWTPVFDLSDANEMEKINQKADQEIDDVLLKIKNKITGCKMNRALPGFLTPLGRLQYNSMRKTANLSVNDSCIGCGLCERQCPHKAIKVVNGKPCWVKRSCSMCLRCLHSCPTFSIQCGKNTEKHGQYLHK